MADIYMTVFACWVQIVFISPCPINFLYNLPNTVLRKRWGPYFFVRFHHHTVWVKDIKNRNAIPLLTCDKRYPMKFAHLLENGQTRPLPRQLIYLRSLLCLRSKVTKVHASFTLDAYLYPQSYATNYQPLRHRIHI